MNINALLSRIRPEATSDPGLKPSTLRLISAMENRNMLPKDIDYEGGDPSGNALTRTITMPRSGIPEASDEYFEARMGGPRTARSTLLHEASHVDQKPLWEDVPPVEGEYSPIARAGRAELERWSPSYDTLRNDVMRTIRPQNPLPALLTDWDTNARTNVRNAFDEVTNHDMQTKEILADSNARMVNAAREDDRSGQLPLGDDAFRRSLAISATSQARPQAVVQGTLDALSRHMHRRVQRQPWLLEEATLPDIDQGNLF